jgi:tRNA A-37 threonylcarbamoyl transferase component Bud32
LFSEAGKAAAEELGINTPKVIAFGQQWNLLFERRSFFITANIPDAEAIERKLPDCFYEPQTNKNNRKKFIEDAAEFIRKFHETGFRHRDLYFSHIFYDGAGQFFLIDLSRAFRPLFLDEYYRVKDIAQLSYSAPAKYFSNTDRLRFYCAYTGCRSLTKKDKRFITKVIKKVSRIARHDKKHNRSASANH